MTLLGGLYITQVAYTEEGYMRVKWKSPTGKIVDAKEMVAEYGPGKEFEGTVVKENARTFIVKLENGDTIKKKKSQVKII